MALELLRLLDINIFQILELTNLVTHIQRRQQRAHFASCLMTTNLHTHRPAARSLSEIAEEKCARLRRETRVLQQQPPSATIFS